MPHLSSNKLTRCRKCFIYLFFILSACFLYTCLSVANLKQSHLKDSMQLCWQSFSSHMSSLFCSCDSEHNDQKCLSGWYQHYFCHVGQMFHFLSCFLSNMPAFRRIPLVIFKLKLVPRTVE